MKLRVRWLNKKYANGRQALGRLLVAQILFRYISRSVKENSVLASTVFPQTSS